MNAIIRHLNGGEYFLARLDDSGDAVELSAALPITDVFGRDVNLADLTERQWEENFGYADLEPIGDDADPRDWAADRIAVVHAI